MIRQYTLGMPQLLFGGLSERWLLKEAGDFHWQLLCADLGVDSGSLTAASGERLYGSFLRVRWQAAPSLLAFRENDRLTLAGALSRFGEQRYFSRLVTPGGEPSLIVDLASVFVARETDNRSLARSAPAAISRSSCMVHEELPEFGLGHRLAKGLGLGQAEESIAHDPGPAERQWSGGGLWSTEYAVSPYHDLNGVGLLYFASYPRIHDVCERHFVHAATRAAGWRGDWATATSVRERDVFYYGNAEIDETLRLTIHAWLPVAGARVLVHSSLTRAGDNLRIADLYTVRGLDAEDALLQRVMLDPVAALRSVAPPDR